MSNEINNPDVQQAVNEAMATEKKKKKKKRLIILAVIVAIIVIIAVASGSGGSSDSEATTTSNNSISASDKNSDETNNDITATQSDTVDGEIGDYICTIKSAEIVKNWTGKDSVKITYEFTNNSSDAESFDLALSDDVYQDGVGLETTFVDADDDDWGIDVKIKPGTTKEVAKVYELRDTKTPLEIEISELISFSDDKLVYNVNLE
jgi:hypothetical protein